MSKAPLGQVEVGTSNTTVVSGTSGSTIDAATAVNTTGSAITIDVFLDSDGTTASTATQVYSDLSINANTSVPLSNLINHYIGNGGRITAIASATGVTVTVSGRTGV